jgi:hypothetical protein
MNKLPMTGVPKRSKTSRRRLRRFGVAALVAVALTVASVAVTPSTAAAATVRPGARTGQIDVLLDGYETQKAASSYWGATVICWQLGLPGWMTSFGLCQTMVSVCAANAYVRHRWAGMTVTWTGGYWCWTY